MVTLFMLLLPAAEFVLDCSSDESQNMVNLRLGT